MIQPVSFNGIIRNNIHKLKNRKQHTNTSTAAENNNDKKLIKNKIVRNVAIGVGSLIGAAALALTGLYLYKRPTKADKALMKMLEEKFAPFEQSISEIKNEITKYAEEYTNNTKEFIQPLIKDDKKLAALPAEVSKENKKQVLKQIEEYIASQTPDSFLQNAIKNMNDFCDNFSQKISANFKTLEQKYAEFTEIIYGKLPESRHSKKIVKNYKEKAQNYYEESKLIKLACKDNPQYMKLDFEDMLLNFKLREVNTINSLLEQSKNL